MNKIDFAKINKKEDMTMVFNQLKDDYSILFQQINQLTNNWNELEKYINKEKYQDTWGDSVILVGYLLDKMKEIKEENK